MRCDSCGSGDAVVHLTQIVNNQMSTFHLCERCASEKGLESPPEPTKFSLTDFLAQTGEGDGGTSEPAPGQRCSFCGLAFRNFRESGRLGCPHCYTVFETHLRSLLRRIHGGTQHLGKVYLPPDPTASETGKRLDVLRSKLQRAVAAEDFERAARLRDEIRTLEPAR